MMLTPITILLMLYSAFVTALTAAEYRQDRRAQYLFKPACALGFILIALMSGALATTYGQIILAALCLCAVGDVALLSRKSQNLFLLGMAAFACGHLAYIFAFIQHGFYFAYGGELYFAFSAVLLTIIPAKHIISKTEGPIKRPACIYAGIIALLILFAMTTGNPILIIASFVFAISDFFVGKDRFMGRENWHALAITPLYFGAQALFALSVSQAL